MSDFTREPFPDRIFEDLGGAFSMGCIGGFVTNFFKGMKYSSTKMEMLSSGMLFARRAAPSLGTSFALWGGTFSCFDCLMAKLRGKEDHWNAIFSGTATGGLLAIRGGLKTSLKSAMVGGILLTIIESVSIGINRKTIQTPRQQFKEYQRFVQMSENQDKKSRSELKLSEFK
ncbi:mitochondrial import inner membrane translocase subunit TIM17 [Cryptosporidium ubiquitum]|uniref:Mitochondrial import inner membrane translocase subunit TIM17 n=1 Tax=Cryptosporidium ubiquitum TaxID=857276 RepID=A0A1J4MEG1_9CRYT|nr:mitochondrial import inner membrane translocase subunit TIM17 [Cryptosporidium ubiquitum]OII71412.1 mitochondrial import inner membrane translocase subunit TIM17 [Cryptosporidium ubiquitum]